MACPLRITAMNISVNSRSCDINASARTPRESAPENLACTLVWICACGSDIEWHFCSRQLRHCFHSTGLAQARFKF
eukprot:7600310-Pyramimonas_sp.AAC.1